MPSGHYDSLLYLNDIELIEAKKLRKQMIGWIQNKSIEVPSIPKIVSEAVKLANLPNASVRQLEELISKDQAISARLVQIGNSPLLRGIEEVKSIHSAIMRIGQKELKSILLGTFVETRLFRSKVYGPLIAKMWNHSMACGCVARTLSEYIGIDPELAYFAGFLHDVGSAALVYTYINKTRESNPVSDQVLEYALQGIHAAAGGIAVKKWGMSDEVIAGITYHHDFSKAKDNIYIAALIQIADIACHQYGVGLSLDEIKDLDNTNGVYYPLKMSYDKAKETRIDNHEAMALFTIDNDDLLERLEKRIPEISQELQTPFVSRARLEVITPTIKAQTEARKKKHEERKKNRDKTVTKSVNTKKNKIVVAVAVFLLLVFGFFVFGGSSDSDLSDNIKSDSNNTEENGVLDLNKRPRYFKK